MTKALYNQDVTTYPDINESPNKYLRFAGEVMQQLVENDGIDPGIAWERVFPRVKVVEYDTVNEICGRGYAGCMRDEVFYVMLPVDTKEGDINFKENLIHEVLHAWWESISRKRTPEGVLFMNEQGRQGCLMQDKLEMYLYLEQESGKSSYQEFPFNEISVVDFETIVSSYTSFNSNMSNNEDYSQHLLTRGYLGELYRDNENDREELGELAELQAYLAAGLSNFPQAGKPPYLEMTFSEKVTNVGILLSRYGKMEELNFIKLSGDKIQNGVRFFLWMGKWEAKRFGYGRHYDSLINKTPQLICAYGEIEKPNEMPLPPEDEIDELFEK